MRTFAIALTLLLGVSSARAEIHETRIPLRDGKLQTADLSAALLEKLHIKGVELSAGSIDLTGLRGCLFIKALNASLGDGCRIEVRPTEIMLRTDPAMLPDSFDALRHATRVFTAVAAPEATAAQCRSYGLTLPAEVSPHKPLVVLVHGLDCNRSNWTPMADLLRGEGFSVAFFTYPSDGPLEESAALLTREMAGLRQAFPQAPVQVIAFSMGGLVARRYLEGDEYAGGVEHFILLGTPNLGSRWATYRWALEAEEHYGLWKREPAWHWTWMITDGLGEAGRDLKPTSKFLQELNARSRRAGVHYTVVAGTQHPALPIAANAITATANLIPRKAANWPGFRQTDAALRRGADRVRNRRSPSDGPVNLDSTRLEGVDDYVVLPADHTALYYPSTGGKPAAWEIIRDRLAR